MPELLFDKDSIPDKSKKKKVKKRVFYGMKCRKGFTKVGAGQKVTIETFWTLKKWQDPNPYVKEIYVFDTRKKKVLKLNVINPKDQPFYKILHGPYKRETGGEVVEEGVFYIGTKHARWEQYGKEGILIDKTKYYKGWPKESKITYYDAELTKIKEVKPMEFGKLNGDYYYFNEKGQPMVYGKYIDGIKAGIWVEYYEHVYKRKNETKYPDSPYKDEQFEPYIITAWDDQGNLLIQDGKEVPPTAKPNTNRPPGKNQKSGKPPGKKK
ncbi:MAG: toxin-antitoxin system YwqK family antitoxin [Cytophagaceae bacterium]